MRIHRGSLTTIYKKGYDEGMRGYPQWTPPQWWSERDRSLYRNGYEDGCADRQMQTIITTAR